jgi:hypothetical protein
MDSSTRSETVSHLGNSSNVSLPTHTLNGNVKQMLESEPFPFV